MQIQVNTDKNVEGRDRLVALVEDEVETSLSRFSADITRVEVHLGDESAGRSTNDDQRCTIEVRSAGQQPLVATHHAGALDQAWRGATRKVVSVLESRLGRRRDHRKGADVETIRTAEQPAPDPTV